MMFLHFEFPSVGTALEPISGVEHHKKGLLVLARDLSEMISHKTYVQDFGGENEMPHLQVITYQEPR